MKSNLYYLFMLMTLIYILFYKEYKIENMKNSDCKCGNTSSYILLNNNINKITKKIIDIEKKNKKLNNEISILKPIIEKNRKITNKLELEVLQFNKDMLNTK